MAIAALQHRFRLPGKAPALVGIMAASVAVGAGIARVGPSMHMVLVAGIAAVILTPIGYRLLRGTFDAFEPTVAFMLAWGVMFVLRPIVVLASGDLIYERPTRVIDISSTFGEMLGMALVGAVAFLVAYAAPHGRKLARSIRTPGDYFVDTAALATFGVAAVGVAAFVLFATQAGGLEVVLSGRGERLGTALQSSSTYVWTAPFLLVPAALVFFMLWGRSRNPGFLIAAVAVTLLVLVRSIPVGSRMMLLPFATSIPIAYFAARNKRPTFHQLMLLGVAALFASTLLLNTRSAASRGQEGLADIVVGIVANPASILDPILSGADTEEALTLAAALQIVPEETGHTWGSSIAGDLVTRPVPREWWPEKPEIPRRVVIAGLWPGEYSLRGGGSANPEFSALLFWYMDFGWPGIIGGMALYGFVSRMAYEYFMLHSRLSYARMLYGLTFGFIIIALRDSPVDTAIRAVFMLVPLWIILQLSRRRAMAMVGASA